MMNEEEKKMMKNLAQHVADTSAMFMPMSGFAMIGAGMLAEQAGKLLGEEIKPTESAFEGTVRMVNTIRKPLEEQIEPLREALQKIGRESYLLHKEHKYDQCAKDIWNTLQKFHLLKDSDYCRKIEGEDLKDEE